MRLYVMRHGPAEGSSPSGRDFDRALSENGRAETSRIARELQRRGERIDRILSSPLVRARETAEIVRGALGGKLEIREELAPSEASPDILRDLPTRSAEHVMLVGHAPDVSILVMELLGHGRHAFEPAMVVAVDFGAAGATESFVIRPSTLHV
jgi:phosphohistidine phosphatase